MHQYAYKIRHTELCIAESVAVSKRPVRRVQSRDPAGAGTARSEARYHRNPAHTTEGQGVCVADKVVKDIDIGRMSVNQTQQRKLKRANAVPGHGSGNRSRSLEPDIWTKFK